MINYVYHVSLPQKTKQEKFQRKKLPPFLIMVSVRTKEILSITKLFVYFSDK